MKKKWFIVIALFVLAIVLQVRDYYDTEGNLIADLNVGSSANHILEFWVIEEIGEETYICVGESTQDDIVVAFVEYDGGFMHSKRQGLNINQIYEEDKFKIDTQNTDIIYGFVKEPLSSEISIDERVLPVLAFDYSSGEVTEIIGFWYYVL